jgi:hypothetical protein
MKNSFVCNLRGWDSCIEPVSNIVDQNSQILASMTRGVGVLSNNVSALQSLVSSLLKTVVKLNQTIVIQSNVISMLQKAQFETTDQLADLQTMVPAVLQNITALQGEVAALSTQTATHHNSQYVKDCMIAFFVLACSAAFYCFASAVFRQFRHQKRVNDFFSQTVSWVGNAQPTFKNVSLCVNGLVAEYFKSRNLSIFNGLQPLIGEQTSNGAYMLRDLAFPSYVTRQEMPVKKPSLCDKVCSFFSGINMPDNVSAGNGDAYSYV